MKTATGVCDGWGTHQINIFTFGWSVSEAIPKSGMAFLRTKNRGKINLNFFMMF